MTRVLRTLSPWLVIAIACAFAASILTIGQVSAQSPPSPKLSYHKVAGPEVPIGGGISFTMSISNSGNLDSGSQTLQDVLPDGIDWQIAPGYSWDECAIEGQQLLCSAATVPKPFIVGGVIVNGSVHVTVTGIALECGDYENTAIFNSTTIRRAVASVTCPPTPTPTPTNTPVVIVVTATPTNTPFPPTLTPTPPPSSTSTPVVVTATPTVRIAPGPPNTGGSPPSAYAESGSIAPQLAIAGLVAIALGTGILGFRGWRSERRE